MCLAVRAVWLRGMALVFDLRTRSYHEKHLRFVG